MEKIESFKVDHDLLVPGLYISRVDGDIVTYDIRTRKPNNGDYMAYAAMHTIEHLVATYVRNSEYGDKVIYFGPMGCRTGFYLLLKESVTKQEVIQLVVDAFSFVVSFNDAIPGATRKECGNWLEHDIIGAQKEAANMLTVLKDWTEVRMNYPKA